MSYSKRASAAVEAFIGEDEVEKVDVVVSCGTCLYQPDEVFFNKKYHLLYWTCPNGHKGFIEDFNYLG
jgi:hypothetical protein